MCAFIVTLSMALGFASGYAVFLSGKPIWPEAREKEKNLFVGFRAEFEAPEDDRVVLRVAASTTYRAFVNGSFCGYGPARAAHGYFRVDEWDMTDKLRPGKNLVAIEVAGYNVNGYAVLDQPSFLQAEVLAGAKVLASTGGQGAPFVTTILKERVQKVQRYSFQRPFSEVYRLSPDCGAWRRESTAQFEPVPWSVLPEKKLLLRRVPYPSFSMRQPVWHVSSGKVETGVKVERLWKDRALRDIGPKLGGYREEDLEVIPSIELQHVASVPGAVQNQSVSTNTILQCSDKSYHILDFGTNLTGFIGATITCREETRLVFLFDEILSDGNVDFKRLGCVNIVSYEMPQGTYTVESFEPYTLRYLKLIVLNGDCDVQNVYLREYANPDVWEAHFAASDEQLNRLFDAGRETFRQNAVDIFMDCPSRERAGWLCDSFFTARSAFALSGDTRVEKNFFENFLLPDRFDNLPQGMLPMCYPADHYDGVFIPNWALWFVVQLDEYLARSGDSGMVDALKPKVLGLFDYLKHFKNDDGLLEKLESWIFIEWSEANNFVRDVNYPTNMLYAGALAAAARMYNAPDLLAEADRVRDVIRRQSFDGTFFVDNAVRKNGKLVVTRNRSETCQYYAFFFDVATPGTYSELWGVLCQEFGPQRKQTKAFPEIHMANSFVGNVLRFEILSRYGRCQQVLDESVAYLLYMAERTGTLWENDGAYASCNHGFASHIVHTLYRDVLGLYRVDPVRKVVQLRFGDSPLAWCEGRIPTDSGGICLRWRKGQDKLHYRISVPAGYTVQIQNLSGAELVRE